MNVGISIAPIYDIHGEKKRIDGIGTYTHNLIEHLNLQAINVEKIYFKKISDTLNIPKKPGFTIASNPLLTPFAKKVAPDINLLHVTDYIVPKIKNIPVVATVHDAIMLKHPEWVGKSAFLKGYLLKKLIQNADHIITCSQAMIADMVHYWQIPIEKISVTYYGLAENWFNTINSEIQQQVLKKYQLNKPFFLMVGTLQARKNIDKSIDAYLRLPNSIRENFPLVIVGKSHSNLTPKELIHKLKTHQGQGQVIWINYIAFNELQALYQSAYLLLFPSLAEGFGFPILEAFASEIPVITSNFGSMAELAGNAAYLIDSSRQEAITEALNQLVNNHDLRLALIQKGKLRAKAFSWQNCSKQTIELYQKLI